MKQKALKLDFGYLDRVKLECFPWPWPTGAVEEIKISEIFHFIPANQRRKFMEELYRVLSPDGKATILTPYYSSSMAVADPETEWPPICEQSFLYFNKAWRASNGMNGNMKCNFDFNYGVAWAPEVASRSVEVQAEWLKTKLNAAHKLQVVLTKAKE